MTNPFDDVAVGTLVITKPKTDADRHRAYGQEWGMVAVVSAFRDEQGRRWGVGVPLQPASQRGHGGQVSPPTDAVMVRDKSNVPGRSHAADCPMVPDPRAYMLLPLFEGAAPYKTRPGMSGTTASMGHMTSEFEPRVLYAQAAQAWRAGVPPRRLGAPDRAHDGHKAFADHAQPSPRREDDARTAPAGKTDTHAEGPPAPRPRADSRTSAHHTQADAGKTAHATPMPDSHRHDAETRRPVFPSAKDAIITTTDYVRLDEEPTPRQMERAERFGAAQTQAAVEAIPRVSAADLQRVAAAYGIVRDGPREPTHTLRV